MELVIENIKYKKVDGNWLFFVVKGDGGLLINNHWYHVINKETIFKLDNFYNRVNKLERIIR